MSTKSALCGVGVCGFFMLKYALKSGTTYSTMHTSFHAVGEMHYYGNIELSDIFIFPI
jgi:hypothetical protein